MKVLEVNNLNKKFGQKQALFDVTFDVEPGTILGLIGPNGAGKSTIMKSIVGLIDYNNGSIKINGESLTKNNRKGLKNVGSMIESPAPYLSLTGYQNLKLFNDGSTTEGEIKEIMKDTQIDSFCNRKAKKYSLGMKQRLGIAISLLNHPKLLILDEPMNGLDPQSTHDLRDLLLKLSKRGISVLISSHLLDELARIADYYVVINHGRVVKESDAKSFLSSDNQNIKFTTDDTEKAYNALVQAGFEAKINDKVVEIKDDGDAMNKALAALNNAGLEIQDVSKDKADLEESLLNLLTEDNKKEETK
ncbi:MULTISPECIES: ABC transporter ATP-binding protein [Apilactobacillus]|uniref:ABC transporter ATP-binding protein n=1 Tax=Apilactobacillus micheneri TaxID=1899430 RepID=A0A9Q8MUD9_9LACO|nr:MULTISPECIES: ABC transporter ATP-binding protein [Apilactobacillus]TPR18179.1 ABC transporter ATP-binding protein [Apilactobacillus timberlakei]TPR24962.1 ABC transporter ATP-binding protein [Apilactobacillus timberlakei]TPR41076.1 ABC transporter ATP-binding protein [Apilactobacillus micheneri]TPR46183.1 ABC transporter ATP-binding protein [Apilactobacillus micheneri]TPR46868.1 ABC transporter ATP-binding protein [Apilactobacillus micheneri]